MQTSVLKLFVIIKIADMSKFRKIYELREIYSLMTKYILHGGMTSVPSNSNKEFFAEMIRG